MRKTNLGFDRWIKVKNRQHPAFSRVADQIRLRSGRPERTAAVLHRFGGESTEKQKTLVPVGFLRSIACMAAIQARNPLFYRVFFADHTRARNPIAKATVAQGFLSFVAARSRNQFRRDGCGTGAISNANGLSWPYGRRAPAKPVQRFNSDPMSGSDLKLTYHPAH